MGVFISKECHIRMLTNLPKIGNVWLQIYTDVIKLHAKTTFHYHDTHIDMSIVILKLNSFLFKIYGICTISAKKLCCIKLPHKSLDPVALLFRVSEIHQSGRRRTPQLPIRGYISSCQSEVLTLRLSATTHQWWITQIRPFTYKATSNKANKHSIKQ